MLRSDLNSSDLIGRDKIWGLLARSLSMRDRNSGHKIIQTTEAGTPKADVSIRVRRRIVQIQREHAGIGSIVPVAAAFERIPLLLLTLPPL